MLEAKTRLADYDHASEVVSGDDALVERERRLDVVQLCAVQLLLHDVAAPDMHD